MKYLSRIDLEKIKKQAFEIGERILGVYGEDRKKLMSDFWKKEFPLSTISLFATLFVHPHFAFISLYSLARSIAHLEKESSLHYQETQRKIKFGEKVEKEFWKLLRGENYGKSV